MSLVCQYYTEQHIIVFFGIPLFRPRIPPKIFIPNEACKSKPQGYHLTVSPYYCDVRKGFRCCEIRFFFCRPFWNFENLFPRSEDRKHSRWGPIEFFLMVFCFNKEEKIKFQFVIENPPKHFGEKPLSCGWKDGWTGIKRVLQFCLVLSELTSYV